MDQGRTQALVLVHVRSAVPVATQVLDLAVVHSVDQGRTQALVLVRVHHAHLESLALVELLHARHAGSSLITIIALL